jgi:hypothetical protein
MSTIRAGDAVVVDTRSRDRRLRRWCLCEARRLRKAAKEAHAHAERLYQASVQLRAVGEALRET